MGKCFRKEQECRYSLTFCSFLSSNKDVSCCWGEHWCSAGQRSDERELVKCSIKFQLHKTLPCGYLE